MEFTGSENLLVSDFFPPREDLRDIVDGGGGIPVSDCLLLNLISAVTGEAILWHALAVILVGVPCAECCVFLQSCRNRKAVIISNMCHKKKHVS